MFANLFATLRPTAARTTGRSLSARRVHRKAKSRQLRVEPLEDRRLLALTPIESLPALHSNLGAPASLYLDFNGDYEPASGYGETWTPVYDSDGDPTTFSDAELTNIQTIWAMVAEDFAPFNIDVTTVEPPVLADNAPPSDANGVALRVAIGGNSTDWYGAGGGGLACRNSFTNDFANIAYVFPNFPGSRASYTADSASQLAGGSFGLYHQSTYDANGVKVSEYNPGDGSWSPLMGFTLYPVSTWYNGMNSVGVLQDDMAILAGNTNGFGYRSDDHGDTMGTATVLTKVGNTWSGAGIIGTNSDVDAFSFTVTAADSYRIAANVAAIGPNLDAVLELRNSAGEVIASASPQNTQNAQVLKYLTPGDYYLSVKSTGVYGWVGQYTVGIDSPPEGIIVTPASTTMTTGEDGSQASFTVVLKRPPTADVTIGLSSSNTNEGTVSPTSLTFTSADWSTPRTVTVTGVDDALVDGNKPYTIVTAPATSADPNYNVLDAADVALTNNDNDNNIYVSMLSAMVTTEAGGSVTFRVGLRMQPTAPVTIGLASSDTTEGTVSPASLTFTPENWSASQVVTVTGVNDAIVDGNVAYTIVTAPATSADPNYNGRDAVDVALTNYENDTAGITFTPVLSRMTTEAGGTATFSVVLNAQPTANVTIGLASSDTTEGTLSTASLTFTPANWNTPQILTVTGVNDSVVDGHVVYAIVTAPAISTDPGYQEVNSADVTVINLENSVPETPHTKFYVADDSADKTYEYTAGGGSVESNRLNNKNTAPRGAASTSSGARLWVVDANRKVYLYSTNGGLLGSWTAGTLASNAVVEGIATNGTDVWIVDASTDKVYYYSGAASRLSGSQNATSSFSLDSANTNPKDITTNGTYLWVVNDSTTDKVFRYTVAGSLVGSWTIDPANSLPTGLTIDPSSVNNIWIVDRGTKRVYQYNAAAYRNSGNQVASTYFALASGNTNPQGIADPPAPSNVPAAETRVLAASASPASALRATGEALASLYGTSTRSPAARLEVAPFDAKRPMVAMNTSGVATAIWVQPDDTHLHVYDKPSKSVPTTLRVSAVDEAFGQVDMLDDLLGIADQLQL